MEEVKKIVSNIFSSSLTVIQNAGLTAILYGIEYLVDINIPCPCDPNWNTAYTASAFLLPTLILLLFSLLVIPDLSMLVKCEMRIRSPEGEQRQPDRSQSHEEGKQRQPDRIRSVKESDQEISVLIQSSQVDKQRNSTNSNQQLQMEALGQRTASAAKQKSDSRGDSRITHTYTKGFTSFLLNTLMKICTPPAIWIAILLLDGDYVACPYATAINRTQIHLCKHLCSLEASSDLLFYCHWSRISGELLLAIFVFMLVLLKFYPICKRGKCTREDYYKEMYEHLFEKKKREKIEKELENKAEKTASEEVKDFISKLEIAKRNQQGEGKPNQTTDTDEAGPSESSP